MKIFDYIQMLSLNERDKKHLYEFLKKKEKYESMDKDELEMHYIKICTRYEHKKIILLTLMSTIFISMLSNTWKYFFSMIEKLIIYMYSGYGNSEIPTEIILSLTIIFSLVIFGVIAGIIIDFFHSMKIATEDKLFLERLINKSND